MFVHAANGTDANSRKVSDSNAAAGIHVNTVRPREKTLERTLAQPGSIKPWAQAELYAKTSGYLKTLQHAPTPQTAADVVAQRLAVSGPAIACAARLAVMIHVAVSRAPEIDIGSPVKAGELLLEIATPDLQQAIVEKNSFVQHARSRVRCGAHVPDNT